jgi:hypothetical protein
MHDNHDYVASDCNSDQKTMTEQEKNTTSLSNSESDTKKSMMEDDRTSSVSDSKFSQPSVSRDRLNFWICVGSPVRRSKLRFLAKSFFSTAAMVSLYAFLIIGHSMMGKFWSEIFRALFCCSLVVLGCFRLLILII